MLENKIKGTLIYLQGFYRSNIPETFLSCQASHVEKTLGIRLSWNFISSPLEELQIVVEEGDMQLWKQPLYLQTDNH